MTRKVESFEALNANIRTNIGVQDMDVLNFPLITTANVGSVPPAAAAAGVSAVEYGDGILHQTVFTLGPLLQTVTDALAYASTKIYDFPAGRINILGCTANVQFAVTTDRTDTTGTINASAALKWGLGTAAASNITLASTMVDLMPKTAVTLDGAEDAYTALAGSPLAAAALLDGTGTAKDAFFNVGFETNTEIDNDGVLACNGTITLTWINLGDY